ncbi:MULTISPECIES: DUF4367 domain-containing protein [unclassified Clostridium]|uniref:DUF4367 domain-containing protein n=1 Tax=unclassified Clostridium TaxID=2614128 RepID=UPI000EF0C30D|nr:MULTISPECIES: DUF4367 domain-containing protein [unclassified Clostridium]HCQ91724.1 hypothetical protein [Clostridium sp.]
MSKKSIEDKFSAEIDAYFNGIEKKSKSDYEEYNEFLELGKILADKDFSEESNKEAVFKKTLENINQYKGENIIMKSKRNKLYKRLAGVGIACIVTITLSQTSFAQNFVEKIIKSISLEHVTVVEYEKDSEAEIESMPVPEKLKGKLFDKDGNLIEIFTKEIKKFYTADGEEIDNFDMETGEIITVSQAKEKVLEVKDANELNKYTCFNVILPSYLPEGYKFDRAEFFKGKTGIVKDSKYIYLKFINEETGKNIYMQQRFACEETGFSSNGSNIEKIKINETDAILSDGKEIDWEYNDVIYSLTGKKIGKNELIKIAESIK